jgi:hypothetical protein
MPSIAPWHTTDHAVAAGGCVSLNLVGPAYPVTDSGTGLHVVRDLIDVIRLRLSIQREVVTMC